MVGDFNSFLGSISHLNYLRVTKINIVNFVLGSVSGLGLEKGLKQQGGQVVGGDLD